jgi:photosystem II stability/assembly factor-like uncharacterized protein
MRFDLVPFRAARALPALALATAAVLVAGCSTKTLTPTIVPPLSRIVISPVKDSLAVGGMRQFVATAYDTNDVVVKGVAFNWVSTDGGVASITSNGFATAVGEGNTHVIAMAGNKADTANVFVFTQDGWYEQVSSTAQNLNGVTFRPDGRTGWAVGDQGTIVWTRDAGTTWASRNTGAGLSDLNGVWFTSDSVGYAVGKGGTVVKTTNLGAVWTRLTTVATVNDFNAVHFQNPSYGWAVGGVGIIARTRDGGVTWTKVFPTAQTLYGVSFADTLNGWAVGNGGVVLGTRDGGASWYIVTPAITGQTLKSVVRLTDKRAWAVGSFGTVARTLGTPDSLAWSTGSMGASNSMDGVAMADTTTGYAVGASGGGVVYKTVTGGASWYAQNASSLQALHAVWFVDALRGWAVGASGRIVHTSHGGTP